MDVIGSFFFLVPILIYLAGIGLILYIMILTIQTLRLAIQALKKYLQQ